MKNLIKLLLALLLIFCAAFAIHFVLSSESAQVSNPKGIMAHRQLHVITRNILLMLLVVVPTMVLLFLVAWKYRATNTNNIYTPEKSLGPVGQTMLWIIPALVIAVMTYHTWFDAHELDPFRPLESEVKPLQIQVVALNWKWLFIYPEQGIAAVNFVQFPDKTPINFELAADGSPMNSFWIPQLSGQIYAMTGMVTPLKVMADAPGEYAGKAAEINGEGYASMTFVAKSSTSSDFDAWVAKVRESPLKLTESLYKELLKPSLDNPVALYSDVEKKLFDKIVQKYMTQE